MAAGLHADMVRVGRRELDAHPRRLDGPRHADRPCVRRCPNLRPGGRNRPHRAVAERLPGHPDARRDRRFVLVNSGHIQALVNPPDPKTRRAYRMPMPRRRAPTIGSPRPLSTRAAGGPTTWPGWSRARASSSRGRRRSAARSTSRSPTPRARTSWRADGTTHLRRPGWGRPGRVRPPARALPAPSAETRVDPPAWWGRPVAETRSMLELARLLVDPLFRDQWGVARGDGRPVCCCRGFWPAIRRSR